MQPYLVGFAAAQPLSLQHPVTITLSVGPATVTARTIEVTALDVTRLQDEALRMALCQALRASGASEVASIVSAPVRIEPFDKGGSLHIRRAVRTGAGVVLDGSIDGMAQPDIRIVSADLRCGTMPSQVVLRARPSEGREDGQGEDGRTAGFNFTAVLATSASHATGAFYIVRIAATGEGTVFTGPLTATGPKDEQEAARLVRKAFGPIQSLPQPLIDQIYRPVLALPASEARARRFEFGPAPDGATPLSSIIIPFYGDAFFLNCVYHLQRVLGPGFELVLMVDDPRIWPEVYGRLSARQSSISIPTVLLQGNENYGYARANNVAFRAARGDVIFLMNSDVLILDPTGLTEAADAIRTRHKAREPEAIIGFSLLYEDHTIQHIGMEFPRSPLVGHLRIADHPMKGLPMALYEGENTRRVPAVTGALMALSSHLYRQLGGFDPRYERGDFEDADLCLRAQQIGAEVWLHVRPGLYHLERQSIRGMGDESFREMITHLNCVAFNARWGTHLSEQSEPRVAPQTLVRPARRPISVRKRNPAEASLKAPQAVRHHSP
ncbi:glycosyltransferase [Microvirga arabica]|uniref:glycosyltransferase n=1 Tax=Microvirga arabica TaxID=1128671 RepID=UPI00193ADE60|nr:glycosyltransferase [Microvirga arabica]MBM1171270.1 glycosyltransferase [Microvirga arabica]